MATVAPSTSAVMPVPTPITTPQSSTSCQTSVMKSEATMPPDDQDQRGRDHLADAEVVHEGGGERAEQAEQHEADRHGGGDLGGRPAELLLQRLDHDAGRTHGAGGGQHGEEGGGGDDPAVMDVPCSPSSAASLVEIICGVVLRLPRWRRDIRGIYPH